MARKTLVRQHRREGKTIVSEHNRTIPTKKASMGNLNPPVVIDLPDLPYYTGSDEYQNVMGVQATQGIVYLMKNGYSWFVTDSIVSLKMKPKLRSQPFVSIKLKVNTEKSTAIVNFEDGNDKKLYSQTYGYTDAKTDLILFYTNGVLMLASEY